MSEERKGKRGPAPGHGGRPPGPEKVRLQCWVLPETLAAIEAEAAGKFGEIIDSTFSATAIPPANGNADSSPVESPPSARLTSTISLHAQEQEKALQILDILRQSRSKAGGLSDAVKIALRLCPLDPARIGEAWEAARAQDGRARRRG